MEEKINGTLNYYLESLGASVVVRDRQRGEVMCFRPDVASAQQAAELLEARGGLTVNDDAKP